MGDEQKPAPLGRATALDVRNAPPGPVPGAFTEPRPLGFDFDPIPLSGSKVSRVDCDWVPTPNPDTAPIQVTAANLAELVTALQQLPEAGKGGGRLRADAPKTESSGAVSVKLHGNLVNKVVDWVGYNSASAAAKAHWDTVLTNLKRHEQRHMEIAIEVGNELAALLVGHEIGSTPSIADKVTSANTRMQTLQNDLDSPGESDHGRKKGHAYGDCNIDTSIP
jgi:hypothetical protein